jgi:hypothetical protein
MHGALRSKLDTFVRLTSKPKLGRHFQFSDSIYQETVERTNSLRASERESLVVPE